MNDGQDGHTSHNMVVGRHVREVGGDGHSCEQHLTGCIFGGGTAGDGSNKIDVACFRISTVHSLAKKEYEPEIQHKMGTCSSGARNFRVKYIAPELGYADDNSARLSANAQAPAPPMTQLHMMAAAPPACSPYIQVDMREP